MRIVKTIILTIGVIASLAITGWVVFGSLADASLEDRVAMLLSEEAVADPEISFQRLVPRISADVESEEKRVRVEESLRSQLPEIDFDSADAYLNFRVLPSVTPELAFAFAPDGSVVISGQVAERDVKGVDLLARTLEKSASVDAAEVQIESDTAVEPLPNLLGVANLLATVNETADDLSVSLAGRDIEISAQVENEGQLALLKDLLSRLDGYQIKNSVTLSKPLPQADEFWLEVASQPDGRRVIRGGAPVDSPAVTRILDAVEGSDEEAPLDLISYGEQRRADPEQAAIVADLVEKLAISSQGDFTLRFSEDALHMSAAVLTQDSGADLRAFAGKLRESGWNGESSDEIVVQAADLTGAETFQLSVEDGFVKISGDVRDGSFFESLETEIGSVLSDPLVKNELSIQPDLPESSWSRGIESAVLPFVSGVESGVLAISDEEVRLDGVLLENVDRRLLEHAALDIVPPGARLSENLQTLAEANQPSPEEMAAAKSKLVTELKSLPVYFEVNSEAVEGEHLDTVAKLSELLAGQPEDFRFLVAGFSDSTGNAAYNRKLALNRAGNVRDLLTGKGIPEDRLVLKSLGELGTYAAADKWKARRVEVKLASSLSGEGDEQNGEEN